MQDIRRIVRNQSSRHGASIELLVLHTTEGANRPGISDLEGLASFFDRTSTQASSHKGVDAEGNRCTMVEDSQKAWTQAFFNPVCLSIEQVGFAATSRRQWYQGYLSGLHTTADTLATWHIKHGIPLRHSTTRGVCQHKHLGPLAGGHTDCGPGYPERYVILLARLLVLRKTGKNRSIRARLLKRRLLAAQRRHGVRHPTTTK